MSAKAEWAKALRREGLTYRAIAKTLGVCLSRVVALLNHGLDDDSKARRKKKLSMRACLCCGRPFLSEGPHNRLCSHCRHKDDYMLFAA